MNIFDGLDKQTVEELKEWFRQRAKRLGKSEPDFENFENEKTVVFVDTEETIHGTMERMAAGEYEEAENYNADDHKHYCWECKQVEIPEPEYCCSGSMPSMDYFCGCMGLPIDPPYCDVCLEKMKAENRG